MGYTHLMSDRKLAATLFVDIAGYTSMMQEDEALAIEVQTKFKKHIENTVPEYSGRIVNFYGDGCLMLFDSSIRAVNCAKELQLSFVRSGNIPVRMGIHSGDVMMKEDSVYGDSVNISSRIESMAVPGSVLMSKVVSDQIRNQKNVNTRSIGHFHFKNVDQPMEVFVLIHPELSIPDTNKIKGKLAEAEKPKFWTALVKSHIRSPNSTVTH